MAVRVAIAGRILQLPVHWRPDEGMSHLDLRFIGPLADCLLRESHTYWEEATVSSLYIMSGYFETNLVLVRDENIRNVTLLFLGAGTSNTG